MTQSSVVRATSRMSALEPATPTPTVRVRGLQHSFGRAGLQKQVLFDNHLDIYPGEIVVMTGPSGSGKTTLLTLIGALRTVQEGSLEVCGCELHDASARQLLEVRRKIGFIFQAHNLFESLTARQNVRMGMELFGWPVQQMNRRADEMLARLGLDHRIHYKPGFLSGGQKQRVAIARALAPKPKLVLADEPTAALDAKSGREVVTLFRELADQLDVTILMVTHDNRILDVADRIVNMVDGQIKSNVVVQESALICDFLQKVPIFERMPPSLLADVADRMRVEQFPAGAVIIRQGDPGDNFYLIRKGRVAVSVERDGKSRFIAEMGEGDCFGETALLTGQPRNATVRAAEDSVLYALGKVDFQAAIDSSESLHVELQKVFFARQ